MGISLFCQLGGLHETRICFSGTGKPGCWHGACAGREFGEARAVFAAVDDALDQKLSQLMWDGPESELTLTENAQPADGRFDGGGDGSGRKWREIV